MSVVCSICGEAHVKCAAVVDPNTKKFLKFGYKAFLDGECENCHNVVLTDPEEVQADIGKMYRKHLNSKKPEPLYAYCQVVRTDNYDGCEGQYIRLDDGPVDENDDRLIASCNGIEELKAMAVPSGDRDFTLVECQSLYAQRA